ncbi:MAG: hypothetical protein P8Y68_17695 [Anaerolineales bacterium]
MNLTACSETEEIATQGSSPATTFPANYLTYTDSTSLFSVSYPPTWEVNSDPSGVDVGSMEVLIEKVNSGTLDEAGPILFLGVPQEIGFNPTCNIVVEPIDETNPSLQKIMDETVALMGDLWEDFQEIRSDTQVLDGRESAILEYRATISGVKVQSVFLVTINGDVLWTNGCLIRLDTQKYSEYENDFDSIVRSLIIYE